MSAIRAARPDDLSVLLALYRAVFAEDGIAESLTLDANPPRCWPTRAP